MLPLSLFRRRNFSAANLETFVVYGALSVFFFFLVLFLQQVGGYSPLRSGLSVLPATIILFALSRRVGALSGRLGPRRFMAAGPLIAACGLLLALRIGTSPGYFSEVLPAVVVFALGLSLTVAPLTTTVLAGIETDRAGIASATNNALARVAGLLATAAIGALVAAHFASALHSRLHGVALGAAARSDGRAGAAPGDRDPRRGVTCRAGAGHGDRARRRRRVALELPPGDRDRGGAARARRPRRGACRDPQTGGRVRARSGARDRALTLSGVCR